MLAFWNCSKYTKFINSNINDNLNVPINSFILTPSPSDINMIPPSNFGKDILLELNSINQNISEPDFVSGSRAVLIKSPENDAYENTETFQSRAEIKFGTDKTEEAQNEKNQKGQKVQYPGQAVQVIPDCNKSSGSPKSKKVGFFETGKSDYEFVNYDICEAPSNWVRSPKKVVASVKQTPEVQKVTYDQNKSQVKVKKLEKSPKKKISDLSDFSDESNVSKTEVLQEHNPKVVKKPPKRYSKTPDLRKASKIESEGNDKNSKSRNVLKRSNSDAIMSRRNENGEAVSVKIQFTKDGVKVISDKESIV